MVKKVTILVVVVVLCLSTAITKVGFSIGRENQRVNVHQNKMIISPQRQSTLSQDSAWKGWPSGKGDKKNESKLGFFPLSKVAASTLKNVKQALDLSIVSTYPDNQANNVPLRTTISVAFNESLDKYAPLEIKLFPNPHSFSDPVISVDSKTVSATAVLDSNTTYQLVVMAAVTPDSQWIKPQIGATFSTGSGFSTGSISGNITLPFDPASNVTFAAVFATDMMDNEDPYRVADITAGDGFYHVENLKAGDYLLLGVQDLNGDLQFGELDAISFYDADANNEPDIITVSEGQEVSNINLLLTVFEVVSTYPTDSTLNVPTDTTISITFSLPVDYNEDFHAAIFPPPIDQGTLSMSPDGKTVSIPVILEDSTVYQILVLSAETPVEPQQYLKEPYLAFFSTGPNFPNATIAGNVTFAAFNPSIAFALLLPTDWGGEEDDIFNVTKINLLDGSYTIRNVLAGTYNLAFFADVDGREILSLYSDSITVIEGETITNIDMTLTLGADISLYGWITGNGGLSNVEIEATNTTAEDQYFQVESNFLGYYKMMVSEGIYYLRFDPPENSGYFEKDTTDINITTDTEINITLKRGSIISGQVTDPEDNPVENVQVEVVDTDYNYISDNWTDGTGNYSLTVADEGTYHIRVWPHSGDLVPITIHNITVPPDTILNVQLQYPQLRTMTGTIKSASAAPMDNVLLDILNNWTSERSDTTITDVNGTYAVNLKDGSYTIIFRTREWNNQGYPNQIASPPIIEIISDTTIDFTLLSGNPLTGSVTDQIDNPVENANLSFRENISYREIRRVTTNANGNYSILLVPSFYNIQITPPAFSNLFMQWGEAKFTGIETYDFNLENIPIHDQGNIEFSWGAGQYGLSYNNGGQGFQYPPGQLNNHLFRSYLLIAMSNNQISEEENFQPVTTPHFVVTTPGIISDQDGYTLFDDRWSDFPVGVTVTQKSYIYANDPDDDYVILQLVLRNNDYFAKNIVTGIYCDWDLGNSNDDMGDYDAAHSLGYIYSSDAPDSIHVGSTVLSAGGATSYRVYDLAVEGYLDFEDKYNTLTEGFLQTSAGSGDVRYYIATGPLTLPPASEDSVVVAFAIVAGESLQDLQANAAAAHSKYNTMASVDDESESDAIPKIFSLLQNYPNPYNPSTTIKFTLPTPEIVKIEIYNIVGQKIETLINKPMPAGTHDVEFNAQNLSSGIYFYRIDTGEFQDVKKMVLLR